LRGLGRESPQRLAARVDTVESDLHVPTLHGAREVEVVIDESRHDRCAIEIDDLRADPQPP
jgi:hypothetical protein